MPAIDIPPKVNKILQILQDSGFEAFVVGGCVRDSLLRERFVKFSHLVPKDWDIATSATPIEVSKIFKNTQFLVIPTGIKHGTISLIDGKKTYEVTTYRMDGDYISHRKPREVFFVKDIIQDLSRRDFSINAMAFHPEFGLIDPYNGQRDLANEIICCVGDAKERFNEDALRILRALRFASRFGFEISIETSKAIFECAYLLSFVSKERIQNELRGILCSEYVQKVLVKYTDVINRVLEISKNMTSENLEFIKLCPMNFALRTLALLDGLSKEVTLNILDKLKYDKKSKKLILTLIKYRSLKFCDDKKWIKKYLNILGGEYFLFLLEFKMAYCKAHAIKTNILEEVQKKVDDIFKNKEVFLLKDLAINGEDIQKLGIKKGQKIKTLLEDSLNAVMNEEVANTHSELIGFVKKIYKIP